MNTQQIIGELESERDRLNQAIEALTPGRGGPRLVRHGQRGRRHLSAAARARISRAMTKRWAERKRAAKAA